MAKKNSTSAAQTAAESIGHVASELEDAGLFIETYHRLIEDQSTWPINDPEASRDAQNAIIILLLTMKEQLARIGEAADKLRGIARAGAN